MKKYIIGLAVIFIIWLAYSIHEEVMCRHEGFSEYKVYENGFENRNVDEGFGNGVPFYSRTWDEINSNIKFIDFYYYLSCHGTIKEKDRIYIAKFKTAPNFKFNTETFDVEKYKTQDYGVIPLNSVFKWNLNGKPVLINDESLVYNPDDIIYKEKMGFFFSSIMPHRYSLIWKVTDSIDDGDKSIYGLDGYWLIKRLKINWLENEPLDESHFIGKWERGWLFKSKTDGHYIWVMFY